MENRRSLALTRTCSEVDLKRACHIGKLHDIDNLMFKSPTLDMTPKRKRKRTKADEQDEDTISLQSVDLDIDVDKKKRRRSSLAKMTSLSNLLSPMNKPVKKIGQSLSKTLNMRHMLTPLRKLRHNDIKNQLAQQPPKAHVPTPMRALRPSVSNSQIPPQQLLQPPPRQPKRTLSLKSLLSPSPGRKKDNIKSYQGPAPTPPKRRLSTFWCETVEEDTKMRCTHSEMERQEAIFELYQNEEDLIEDLNMVKSTYHDSLCKLKLMTEDELKQIFGSLYEMIPLHQDLVDQLRDQRLPDGTTEFIGEALINWIPRLELYIPYCANQVYARALLDQKKKDPAIDDFLQRCQESPFSRRLDLWSFLDIPRSRLVKYPLLLRSIQKKTDEFHTDHGLLDRAVEALEEIISEVDKKTGESKCRFTYEKLEFIDDKQKHPLIKEAKAIVCDGILKNNRGTKLHVFLFERVLVLTRPATRGHQLRYQVYRQPIPVSELVLDDLQDGKSKSGSFRSTFSQNSSGKNQFRVTGGTTEKPQSYTLQANDEHDKRQWVSSLRAMLAAERERLGIVVTSDSGRDCVDQNRQLTRVGSRSSFRLRRKSSTSSMASMSSIGSLSSLYSIASYDLDDTSSLYSYASNSSAAPGSPAVSISADTSVGSESFASGGTPPSVQRRSSRRRSSLSPGLSSSIGASPNTTVISTVANNSPGGESQA